MTDFLREFKDSGALLDGHFVLSSGLHSSTYLQCARALEHTANASRYGSEIAKKCRGVPIETVASPAIGGIVIGYATAASLGVRFIWTERQDGEMTLRRGFRVEPGERILVVEDVITTGGSVRECITALEDGGAMVVGVASIVDRSAGKTDVGVPRISLFEMDVAAFAPEDCPMCAAGTPTEKPGSRTVPRL